MGIFGVYVLICTFLLLVYYAVTIWFDFRGNKGKKKDDSEVISAGGIVDTETSTDVKELDGGGYQLSTSSDDEEGYQEIESPEVILGDGQDSGEVPHDEESPSFGGGGEAADDDPDDDTPEPSQFDRAQKVHDEEMNPVERIYQEKLNCRELVAQMSCPLSQKTRIYRRRSVY
jgi:hypothetical protein